MKRINQIIAIVLLGTLLAACGGSNKKKGGESANTNGTDTGAGNPYVPPVTEAGPGFSPGGDFRFGGTANLTVTNSSLTEYTDVGVNAPTDVKVNINLKKYGSGYGGVVAVTFKDNGNTYVDYFSSLVEPGSLVSSNEKNNQYNIWYQKDGKYIFHGFFQDFWGAIIIVIDNVVDLGDGQGPTDQATGSIWFKNFPYRYEPESPTSCWFVSNGPYSCQAWRQKRTKDYVTHYFVDPTTSLYPDQGYQKLGDFSGLSISKAFNGSVTLAR
jgi:hypothetical protein